jgi:hypothetical protein
MTDQVLNLLKFVLLGLLYLFFARVLWAVWSEVRTPSRRPMVGTPRGTMAPTTATPRPAATAAAPGRRQSKKQAKGRVTRLVMLEPKSRRGLTVPLTGDITLGRESGCTITIDDDGQPMVEDLGSTNGTYHNGSKLAGAKLLHPGDRIQVGTTVIEAQ